MKKTAIILFVLACASYCAAQVNGAHHLVHFSTGISQPVGSFGSVAADDPDAGWAGTGIHMELDYTRMVAQRTGLSVSLSGNMNRLRTKQVEQNLGKTPMLSARPVVVTDALNLTFPEKDIYPDWNIQKGSWKTASVLIGGYHQFPLRNALEFFVKVQAGLTYAAAPAIEGSGYKSDSFQTRIAITQTKAHAWGLGYGVSAGICKKISKRLDFMASTSFTGTGNLKFKDVTASIVATKQLSPYPGGTLPYTMVSRQEITGTAHQKIQQLQCSAGIGWRF